MNGLRLTAGGFLTCPPEAHFVAFSFQKCFSVWSVSFLMMVRDAKDSLLLFVVVGLTHCSCAYPANPSPFRGFWQLVSVVAMRFSGIYGQWVIGGPQYVVSLWSKFQVNWKAAIRRVADDVIQIGNVARASHWQCANQPCPHQAMWRNVELPETEISVSVIGQSASPKPAAFGWVNRYLREKALQLSRGQVVDGEILRFSHARVLLERVREWSGLRRCFSTVAARLLYTGLVPA